MKKIVIGIIIFVILVGVSMDHHKEIRDMYIKSDSINMKKEIFTDKELKWIQKHKDQDIYVGVAEDYIPIEYIDKNGIPKGLGIEIIKRLNQLTGLKLKVYKDSSKKTWDEILQSTFEKK